MARKKRIYNIITIDHVKIIVKIPFQFLRDNHVSIFSVSYCFIDRPGILFTSQSWSNILLSRAFCYQPCYLQFLVVSRMRGASSRRVPNQVSLTYSTDDVAKPRDMITFQIRPKLYLIPVVHKKKRFYFCRLSDIHIIALNLQTVRKAEICPFSPLFVLKKRASLHGTWFFWVSQE